MTILCVGNFPALLTTRASLLTARGHKASIAFNRHQAILSADPINATLSSVIPASLPMLTN
jgi:hypothetical protein